jgi:CBS domain-containing protein
MSDLDRAGVVDVMHRGVVSCRADSSAVTAARAMAAHRIHCVVVPSQDGIPRLVTDLDVAAVMYDEQLEKLTCEELSRPSPLLRPEDSLAFALERMHEDGKSHAVVVGPSLRLLGVVSVLDLVEWMLRRRSVERRKPISEAPDVQPARAIDT